MPVLPCPNHDITVDRLKLVLFDKPFDRLMVERERQGQSLLSCQERVVHGVKLCYPPHGSVKMISNMESHL